MQTVLTFYRYTGDRLDRGQEGYLPFASARGCVQTLEPRGEHLFKRTLTGGVYDLPSHGAPGLVGGALRYDSVITCEDQLSAGVDAVGPGMRVWVECLVRLCTPLGRGYVVLPRHATPGSLRLHFQDGTWESLKDEQLDESLGRVSFPQDNMSAYVSYRPTLAMIVQKFVVKTAEWEGKTAWQMHLTEL